MSVDMPKPVADYFAAEIGNDQEALAQCFAEQALVQDEGQTIHGVAAIKQWMAAAKTKYQHTTEPLSVVRRGGKIIVTAKVSGNFPNSPVQLDHIFGLQDDKIISLEIHS